MRDGIGIGGVNLSTYIQETRWDILKLLKKHHAMSASELAAALGISAMGIRQHLAILERDGLVAHERSKPKRGRPTHLYKLTDLSANMFPIGYGVLTLALLDELVKLDGDSKIHDIFKSRMNSQLASHVPRLEDKNLSQKVKELAKIRDEEGYMADAVETDEGFTLREFNCPISMVARKYPHACEYELQLFKNLLGTEISRDCHIMKGDHLCSYKIKVKPSAISRQQSAISKIQNPKS